MKKLLPLLRHTFITTLIFVVAASVLLGLLANYSADADIGQHRTLTGRVLHVFWPLLLFGIYLPVLLLFPLRKFNESGIEIPNRKRKLFLQSFLALVFLNPIVLLWIYSLATRGAIDFGTAAVTVLLIAVAAGFAVLAGLWGFFWKRQEN